MKLATLPDQLWQAGDVDCDTARLIQRQPIWARAHDHALFKVDPHDLEAGGVLHLEAGIAEEHLPRRWEATGHRRTNTERKWLGESDLGAHRRGMIRRFIIRPDREGFAVYDILTAEVAVIAMTPQSGLLEEDAEHTAELLNRRARQGDREVLQ